MGTGERAVAVGLLFASLTLAGCERSSPSDGSSSGLSADEVVARYGYVDHGDGLTPVFVLVPEFKDPSDGYARDLLARRCLAGVVDYAAVPPDQLQDPLWDQRTAQPRFDEQTAAQYGYGRWDASSLPDTAVPDSVVITEDMHSAMVACGQEADARLGNPPERLPLAIENAGWAAIEGDTNVGDAADAWHACMEPVGVIDLPESPAQMPPESVVPSPSIDASGFLADPPQTAVTQAERDVAVADARCRAESGYTEAVHQARSQAELEAIGRDIEGFEAVRAEYAEYQRGVDAVIAELG